MAEREECEAWVQRVLDVNLRGGDAWQTWSGARDTAINALKQLEAAVAKSSHPGVDRALISLRSIRANLSDPKPDAKKVADLENYLRNDDVVTSAETPNVFGVKVELRDPLLQALKSLKPSRAGKALLP